MYSSGIYADITFEYNSKIRVFMEFIEEFSQFEERSTHLLPIETNFHIQLR